jgi:hypothetical protein
VRVTVAETLLVYVVAPLAVVAVLAALTLRSGSRGWRRRYRPGQPWEHEPLWYAPHGAGEPTDGHGADTATQPHGRTQAIGSSVFGDVEGGPAAGGPHLSVGQSHAEASDGRATGPGASAVGAGAPLVGRGGPLGGARGTW